MVVADVRYAVDDFFAIKLQHNTERTVGRRVVRTEVEEHEVLIFGATLHAPIFRFEGQRFHFQILFGFSQLKRVEFSRTRRVVFTQRMAFGMRHQQTRQVRVTFDVDAKHFPRFHAHTSWRSGTVW